MARYAKETNLGVEKITQKAITFFGPGGLGLEIKKREGNCLLFEGGGGHVFIQASDKGKGCEVELETREWDYPVKEFLESI